MLTYLKYLFVRIEKNLVFSSEYAKIGLDAYKEGNEIKAYKYFEAFAENVLHTQAHDTCHKRTPEFARKIYGEAFLSYSKLLEKYHPIIDRAKRFDYKERGFLYDHIASLKSNRSIVDACLCENVDAIKLYIKKKMFWHNDIPDLKRIINKYKNRKL